MRGHCGLTSRLPQHVSCLPFTSHSVEPYDPRTRGQSGRLAEQSSLAFSASDPCNFGLLADFVISVFREVTKNVVFVRYHFYRRLLVKLFTRDACGCFTWSRSFFVHWIFNEFFQPFRQITQRASPWPVDLLIFVFVFSFCGISQLVSPCPTACTPTSCGCWTWRRIVSRNDVDDVLVYGTTMGTSFSVLHRIFVPF